MFLYFLHRLVSSFIIIIFLFSCRKDGSLATKNCRNVWSLSVSRHYGSLCVGQVGVTPSGGVFPPFQITSSGTDFSTSGAFFFLMSCCFAVFFSPSSSSGSSLGGGLCSASYSLGLSDLLGLVQQSD